MNLGRTEVTMLGVYLDGKNVCGNLTNTSLVSKQPIF